MKGECTPRKYQGVKPVVDVQTPLGPVALRGQKPDVPDSRMRDQYGACERGEHVVRDGREGGGTLDLRGVNSVHVRRAADTLARIDHGVKERNPSGPDHPIDAHLNDAIVVGIEPGHFQVDERERSLADWKV